MANALGHGWGLSFLGEGGLFDDMKLDARAMEGISRISILACGTSWQAGLVAQKQRLAHQE